MAIATDSRPGEHHAHEGHHGAGRYWVIWAALLVLTAVTVFTGRMEDVSPGFGLGLALVIATTKGTLVALFFMHLSEHQGVNRLFFAVSLLFVVLMLAIPLLDFGTRFRGSNPPGSQYSDLQAIDIGANAQQGRYGGNQKRSESNEQSEGH
jgi:cytochrome c oxidase subunit 4